MNRRLLDTQPINKVILLVVSILFNGNGSTGKRFLYEILTQRGAASFTGNGNNIIYGFAIDPNIKLAMISL